MIFLEFVPGESLDTISVLDATPSPSSLLATISVSNKAVTAHAPLTLEALNGIFAFVAVRPKDFDRPDSDSL